MSEQDLKVNNTSNIYCVGTQMVVTEKELEVLSIIKGMNIEQNEDNLIEIQMQEGIITEEGILYTDDGVIVTKFSPKDVKDLILNIKQRLDRKKKKQTGKTNIEGINR